jgi:hypothetical protein
MNVPTFAKNATPQCCRKQNIETKIIETKIIETKNLF